MKKICKKIFLFLLFIIPLFSWVLWDNNSDILSDVFKPSEQGGGVIYIWDDKKAVWHTVLRSNTSYAVWTWFFKNAPLIVQIVKVILQITVVWSITMIIFYGIKFMIEIFNWSEIKSAAAWKDLKNVLIWLLIAMFSITAVTLVSSVWKSTFHTSDFTYHNLNNTQSLI